MQPFSLSLSVQYASRAAELPTRQQFRRWVRAAQEEDVQITLRLVDEMEGRELNRRYRDRDYATNVLTFPYSDSPPYEGDIVICAPVVMREAWEQGKALLAHYAHLTIHAVLHLQGYDHKMQDEAARMEARETALMRKLGYPDPYRVSE